MFLGGGYQTCCMVEESDIELGKPGIEWRKQYGETHKQLHSTMGCSAAVFPPDRALPSHMYKHDKCAALKFCRLSHIIKDVYVPLWEKF